jgi:hypothetical protein
VHPSKALTTLTNREALDNDVVLRKIMFDEEVGEELSIGGTAEQETGSDGMRQTIKEDEPTVAGLLDRTTSEYEGL